MNTMIPTWTSPHESWGSNGKTQTRFVGLGLHPDYRRVRWRGHLQRRRWDAAMVTVRQEPDGSWSVYRGDKRIVTFYSRDAAEVVAALLQKAEEK